MLQNDTMLQEYPVAPITNAGFPAPAGTGATHQCLALAPQQSSSVADSVIFVDSAPFTVGTAQRCSLRLPSQGVSEIHAELGQSRQCFWVRDLGSHSGTFVNGQRIDKQTELFEGNLVQFGDHTFEIIATRMPDMGFDQACELVSALEQFDRLLAERLVAPTFEPVVQLSDGHVLGLEVLARSQLLGLETPLKMFQLASQLNLELELSRLLRWEGIVHGRDSHPQMLLFLNTHPLELDEPGLIESIEEVRFLEPDRRIVLEIPERAIRSPEHLSQVMEELEDLTVQVCVDDFAGDPTFAHSLLAARPAFAKFDKSVTDQISQQSESQQELQMQLISDAKSAGIQCVAKGLETEEMAQKCRDFGFELGQGYHFNVGT